MNWKNPACYKKQLCRHFTTKGSCMLQSDCDFAHGVHELRTAENPAYKRQICPLFLQGGCALGGICLLAHGEHDLLTPTDLNNNRVHVDGTTSGGVGSSPTAPELTVGNGSSTGGYRKKRPCWHFERLGSCRMGETCGFSHEAPGSPPPEVTPLTEPSEEGKTRQPPPANYKTSLCNKFSVSGSCFLADRCQFAHGRYELRPIGYQGDFEEQVRVNPKWKCVQCSLYAERGFCGREKCDFAHGDNELRHEHPSSSFIETPRQAGGGYKTRLCRHWENQGYCKSGSACMFAHGEHELRGHIPNRQPPVPIPVDTQPWLAAQATPLSPLLASSIGQSGAAAAGIGQPGNDLITATVDAGTFAEFLQFQRFKQLQNNPKTSPIRDADRIETNGEPGFLSGVYQLDGGNSPRKLAPGSPIVTRSLSDHCGVIGSSPGVTGSSPGVMESSPGVMESSPRVAGSSPGVTVSSPKFMRPRSSPGVIGSSPGLIQPPSPSQLPMISPDSSGFAELNFSFGGAASPVKPAPIARLINHSY